jgi:anti-sigma factor ChrR (cupin superfamily)
MSEHIDDFLMDWLNGTLSAGEEERLKNHVAACEECATELSLALRDFANHTAEFTPVEPSPSLRSRILADAEPGARFLDLSARLAGLIDVSDRVAADLLRGIDDPENWNRGPLPGIELYHLDGGPRVENAIVGFVRIEPGRSFPDHEHVGEETTLVLQGSLRDSDGTVHRRGDQCVKTPGTSHELEALPGPALIYLTIAFDGVQIAGMHIGPDDPRL